MNADDIMSWALFESVGVFGELFVEKWQLANKCFVSKVDCDDHALLFPIKELKILLFFFLNQQSIC